MKSERLILRSYARVSAMLKERIASGEFEIGARLPPERELAIFYDVSRPTIRETIIALEIEGVVSVRPGSGVYVISKRSRLGMTFETDVDLFELLQARRAMESEACALAAAGITSEQLQNLTDIVEEIRECHARDDISGFEHAERHFHLNIAEASGNVAVSIAIVTLWNVRPFSSQTGVLTSKMRSLGAQKSFENHDIIIESLSSQNGNQARLEMMSYYTIIIDAILSDMENFAIDQARARIDIQRQRYL
jgi:DNA-binding FadR family transcriptional regulator